MTKTYLIIMCVAILITVFVSGLMIGRAKCMEKIATDIATHTQQQTITKEKINAEIYRTGVADIRNILRTKYTIAE